MNTKKALELLKNKIERMISPAQQLTSTTQCHSLWSFHKCVKWALAVLVFCIVSTGQSLLSQANKKPIAKDITTSSTKAKGITIASDEDIKIWENSKRVALVVGVNAYQTLSKLNFAVGDSTKMKLSLDQVGHFDKIICNPLGC